jgi:hypothetical protein
MGSDHLGWWLLSLIAGFLVVVIANLDEVGLIPGRKSSRSCLPLRGYPLGMKMVAGPRTDVVKILAPTRP